jgi:hypothetical protein
MMDDPVNFTREPIIETVITPREGYNLAIRSSKGNGHEDYFVDAVEVVSFGHSFFFRSQERPSSFLVPVSDYEVIEVKEARMVLKNAAIDRSIKIGGGREAPPSRPHRESNENDSEKALEGTAPERPPMEQRKRDNKRRRGRRGGGRPDMHAAEPRAPQSLEETPPVDPLMGEEIPKPSSFISKLFPPPPTLIKETLSRYKLTESEDISSQALEEKPEDSLPSDPDLFEPPVDLDGDSPPEED